MTTAVSTQTSLYRLAPAGFTPQQWQTFERDGILLLGDTLSPAEVERYLEAVDRVAAADPAFRADETYSRENIVELDPALAELIDHPATWATPTTCSASS